MPWSSFMPLKIPGYNVPKTGRKPGKSKAGGFPEAVLEKTK